MAKFICFNDEGRLVARYDTLINGDAIPKDAVEVDDELFLSTIHQMDGVWMRDSASGLIEKHPFPPPSRDELVAAAIVQRDQSLAIATARIAPLQDAVDLSIATAVEKALLVSWKNYRVNLNRVDQQSGYPQAIEWPQAPT